MNTIVKLTEQEFKSIIENTILKETGEWVNDEEGLAWIKSLEDEVKKIENEVHFFKVIDVKEFDKYQGPYANVIILRNNYKIWTENDLLWIEGFPIDNTSGPKTKEGFLGTAEEIIDMLYVDYYEDALMGKV